jgi:large conductance mechanosensitive channel
MSLAKDFKAFVMRGNVIDLAVAVIIGGAFAKIVASFVNDILMPPLGMLLGGVDFKDLLVVIKPAREAAMQGEAVVSEAVSAVTWNYGMFVQNVIDFLIIAFAIFMVIRAMSRMQRKQEAPVVTPPPPEPTNEEKLLSEIRDLLKK